MTRNRRFFIRLLLLFQLTLVFICSCGKITKEERIAEINNSVFCLSTKIPNPNLASKIAIGTGFFVADNLLATAFHVKEDLEKGTSADNSAKRQIIAWKKFDNGDYVELPVELLEADKNSDLAIYRFDAEKLRQAAKSHPIKPLVLADRLPNIGEDILSVGYYGILEMPFNSLGNVSTIQKTEDIYSDVTLMPGSSGGPLCSMQTGEVLGVNIMVMTMGDGVVRVGIAKRISKLKTLIEKAGSN